MCHRNEVTIAVSVQQETVGVVEVGGMPYPSYTMQRNLGHDAGGATRTVQQSLC